MRRNDRTRRDEARSTLRIEGHRIVTVSLSPDETRWIQSIISAAKASGAETPTRSLIVRAALRQLKQMVQNDPDQLLQYVRGGQVW